MTIYSEMCSQCKPHPRPRDAELAAIFPVRTIMRRARVSPTLGLAIAETVGFVREAR